ncbi:Fasciclin-like arabinogalactan protein 12 [Linum perenne]
MKNQIILSVSLIIIILLNVPKTLSQSPASAPAANPPPSSAAQVAEIPGPLDVVKILEKAGRFTVFLRLLRSTQENTELYQQLNETHNSATVFAPSDGAFSGLKAGTLNSLSDGDKSELVKFHIVPFAIASTQFQTVSNPIRTQAAGSGKQFQLNVTTSDSMVNVTSGLTNTTVSGIVYMDDQLAIYQVDKVLLPKEVFSPKSLAPAPAPAKHVKDESADSPSVAKDASDGELDCVVDKLNVFMVGVATVAAVVLSFL